MGKPTPQLIEMQLKKVELAPYVCWNPSMKEDIPRTILEALASYPAPRLQILGGASKDVCGTRGPHVMD